MHRLRAGREERQLAESVGLMPGLPGTCGGCSHPPHGPSECKKANGMGGGCGCRFLAEPQEKQPDIPTWPYPRDIKPRDAALLASSSNPPCWFCHHPAHLMGECLDKQCPCGEDVPQESLPNAPAASTTGNEVDPEGVNHPKHYNLHPSGVECWDIVRHHNFNIGSAIKYLWRQGLKDGEPSVKDLRKAVAYIEDQIRLEESLKKENS